MRDDFTIEVKQTLAQRVALRCSNPSCRKLTAGPRDDQSRPVNIGVACHITAASSGGPRYDHCMTTQERKSAGNGIWVCQNCAKLIDNDQNRFTTDTLHQWKRIAEAAARSEVETLAATPQFSPIRVLVVSSEDPQLGEFFKPIAAMDTEIIREAMLPTDSVNHLQNAELGKISEALMDRYHIIHFIVHVDHDGSLILGHDRVSPSRLATVLNDRGVKCALFMTCNSANVIGALAGTDIRVVIAATSNLYTNFCERFCKGFYSALSNGFAFDEAFNHANVLSSQEMTPFMNLRSEGALCFSRWFDRQCNSLRDVAKRSEAT